MPDHDASRMERMRCPRPRRRRIDGAEGKCRKESGTGAGVSDRPNRRDNSRGSSPGPQTSNCAPAFATCNEPGLAFADPLDVDRAHTLEMELSVEAVTAGWADHNAAGGAAALQ